MLIFFTVILGVLGGSVLALIPAFHIYNLVGIFIITGFLPPLTLISLMLGLIIGFSIVNTIPSIYLSAPDESAIFLVLPGQKYMLQGRGHEACMLSGIGSLVAIFALLAIFPFLVRGLPYLRKLLLDHSYWILGSIICFILMSEWPKGGDRGTPRQRFADAWKSLGAGLLTFVLAGFLGMIIFQKPITPVERGFQNLMPAFVGLFAIPWVITNIISARELPEQHISNSIDVKLSHIFHGTFAGIIGGLLAAFLPVVTGGVGGLIAGHATSQRDDRVFIISQGASKVVYLIGGFLFFLVPGLNLRRGGLAWMASTVYSPFNWGHFYWMLAATIIGSVLAFYLLEFFSKQVSGIITRFAYKKISWLALGIVLLIVLGMTGFRGLFVAAVATCIGLIPVLFHSRRMNCLAVILVPITLNMAGLGAPLAEILGLM